MDTRTRVHRWSQHLARIALGAFLVVAGTAHLSFARTEFRAQVPAWIPVDADLVVVASGVVEVLLGLALLLLARWRAAVGWIVAAFFVAVFPGNIAQYVDGRDAFGLDSDSARLLRLFFQPLLIAWALWCTRAMSVLPSQLRIGRGKKNATRR